MKNIQYILNHDIDKQKWDQCIKQAPNGLIYAFSWYLDKMSEQWDALIANDYETVMPLTRNKKYGIHYLYQPYFCATLGVFSKKEITNEMLNSFLGAVPNQFRYWDIYLNSKNLFALKDFPMTERVNYVLALGAGYETISSNYRTNLKRNIKKAVESNLIVKEEIPISDIIQLAKETMQRISDISTDHFNRFKKATEEAAKHEKIETFGIYSPAQELLASAVFLFSHQRWYYLLVGNHPNGKTLGASHYLVDRFIQRHAGENAILDFEGSDIRNLAFFYSSFGATEERYPALRINRLPAIVKWLKN
jgi:hypothetical protein